MGKDAIEIQRSAMEEKLKYSGKALENAAERLHDINNIFPIFSFNASQLFDNAMPRKFIPHILSTNARNNFVGRGGEELHNMTGIFIMLCRKDYNRWMQPQLTRLLPHLKPMLALLLPLSNYGGT